MNYVDLIDKAGNYWPEAEHIELHCFCHDLQQCPGDSATCWQKFKLWIKSVVFGA